MENSSTMTEREQETDYNKHGEVMQETAEYFANKCAEYGMEYEKIAFDEIVEVAKTINMVHKKSGYLTPTLAVIRSETWRQLNIIIKVFFGELIYLAVR